MKGTTRMPPANADINIRDPFVVPVPHEKRYYLCGARGAQTWGVTKAIGLDVYDDGHGMVFETFDGKLMLTLHETNGREQELPAFVPVEATDGTIKVTNA